MYIPESQKKLVHSTLVQYEVERSIFWIPQQIKIIMPGMKLLTYKFGAVMFLHDFEFSRKISDNHLLSPIRRLTYGGLYSDYRQSYGIFPDV